MNYVEKIMLILTVLHWTQAQRPFHANIYIVDNVTQLIQSYVKAFIQIFAICKHKKELVEASRAESQSLG